MSENDKQTATVQTDVSGTDQSKKERYIRRCARVWGWIGIGVIVLAVAFAINKLGDALLVLLTGAFMAFLYAPITNFLDRRFNCPRLLGTFIGLFCFFIAVFLLVFACMPPLTEQMRNLVANFPDYIDVLQGLWQTVMGFMQGIGITTDGTVNNTLEQLGVFVEQQGTQLLSKVGGAVGVGVTGIVSGIINTFMALIISFWLAKDFPRIERELFAVAGPRMGKDYRIVTSVFSRSLGGYLRGLIITSICTGCIAGIGFWIIGVPYSGLLGLVTGVLNVIPYIGPWVGGAMAFFFGLSVSPIPAFLSILVSFFAQEFTDMFVGPKVMQTSVALHPVLVIVALVGGGALAGIVGMVLAVPLTAAVKGVFVYYFESKTGRQIVSTGGALFRGKPFNDENGAPRPACDALGEEIEGEFPEPRMPEPKEPRTVSHHRKKDA